MLRLIFGLILALLGSGAWAVDCSQRLEASFSVLVERAMDKGVLGPSDLQDLLKSEVPVNPLADAVLGSRNSAFHHVFRQYLQMSPEHWREEKASLARLAQEKGLVQESVATARAVTRDLLRPRFAGSRRIPLTGVKWVGDHEGRIFFAGINSADQIEVYNYDLPEPIWRDRKSGAAAAQKFFFGINSAGHPEVTLIHEAPIPKWNLVRRATGKMFGRRTIDLSSDSETAINEFKAYGYLDDWTDPYEKANAHNYNKHVNQRDWNFISVVLPGGNSAPLELQTPRGYLWRNVASYLNAEGVLFLAVDVLQDSKHVLRFFAPQTSADPLFDFEITETVGIQISWFENMGHVLAMAETFNGKTYFFDPDGSGVGPIETFDGRAYKGDFFKIFPASDGSVRLIGVREGLANNIEVFSPVGE